MKQRDKKSQGKQHTPSETCVQQEQYGDPTIAKSEIGEIWRWSYYPSEFKVWINPQYQSIRARIEKWKETVKCATYFYPNGAITWDYIVPAKYYNRLAKLIGVSLRKKHPNRVAVGKATKNLRPITEKNGQKSKSPTRKFAF